MTGSSHPTALISYSHDSPEHEAHVLELCNRLRARGVDAFCDQFLPGAPSEGWPLWMERQIESRDFTLLVCTETYRRRFMEDEASDAGRGVVWEARILRNLLYEDSARQGRIVPVLLDAGAREFVPTLFRGNFYDVSDERGFENLLRHILREPSAKAAALGSLGPQGARWSAFERPWLVPDALRTHFFTGREILLASLRAQLVERKRAVLSGLGGVGKTQAALEYALRHRNDYPDGVFWVNAETTSDMTGGFSAIAETLGLSASTFREQEQVVKAALAWLNETNCWLLILDNVEDCSAIVPFLPERSGGHILITSRESVFGKVGIARAFEVVDLDDEEALRFLLVRTAREAVDLVERAAAKALAKELCNLPLALEQAAAYIAETNVSFDDYLSAFARRRISVLERSRELIAHESVAVTWATNFAAVERSSLAAADVLRISAFLGPDAIPFELFTADPLVMGELLRPLTRYSLARSDASPRTFSVHQLVQEVVRISIPESERLSYTERAISALDAAFPDVEFTNWTRCDRLLPHARTALEALPSDATTEAAARLARRCGVYLRDRGAYVEAEPLLVRSLAIRERALGPGHPDVAQSLNDLANIYYDIGRFADAEPLYGRALTIRESALGPDHLDVAHSLNNLGNFSWSQGRSADAEAMHLRALAIKEKAFGPGHPDVAYSLTNLGTMYHEQGRSDDAETAHLRAVSIRENALGPDHPELAWSLNNLAAVYYQQGRYADAEQLDARALAIREKAFGPDHPDVAHSLYNLAEVYRNQERYDEAERLYSRALAIWKKRLGPSHRYVADARAGLGLLPKDLGRSSR